MGEIKVAVCVSGACDTKGSDESLPNLNRILKVKFPTADFYYATWDRYKASFEKWFPSEKCEYYPEPKMHYHPYLDIKQTDYLSPHYTGTINWIRSGGQKRIEWASHHTKQILIHSWVSDKIKSQYDIIIRVRFDSFVAKTADFVGYIEDTLTHNNSNCFATKGLDINTVCEIKITPDCLHDSWMYDMLIIHPANAIDRTQVDKLHKNKKLHASEYGWYQVIKTPNKHRTHNGWVNPVQTVKKEFLWTV